jgi:hypothetical protein
LAVNLKWGAIHDAFILPSHQENFGMPLLKLWPVVKAVLITNKVNILEIVKWWRWFIEEDNIKNREKLK